MTGRLLRHAPMMLSINADNKQVNSDNVQAQ